MIDLAWVRDVLLFTPAAVTAWRLAWARGYQIRASKLFETLTETEQARLNQADGGDDWAELSDDARKVRDLRNAAATLATFSRLLPTWCLASLALGLALQLWLIVGTALAVEPTPPVW